MLLGATVFAVVAASVAYRLGVQRANADGQAILTGLISAVEKTAAIAAYTGDKVLLQEVVDGLSRNHLSANAEIRTSEMTLLAFQQSKTVPDSAIGTEDRAVEQALFSPFDATEKVGVLRIRPNVTVLEQTARTEATTLALTMVAQIVVVAILLYLVAARFVSRPIIDVATALRKIRPGSEKILRMPPMHANDEIGTLINGANALLDANRSALRLERELRGEIEKMEAQYRQIFDSSSAGIFVLSANGHLINSNPTALQIVGLPLADMKRLKGQDLVSEIFARPERVQEMIDSSARNGDTVSADLELKSRSGHAQWVHCLISVQSNPNATGAPGEPYRGLIEGVMYDITERKKAESAVQHQAVHDVLTGLRNRAGSDALIDQFIKVAQSVHEPVSVMYIDLDGFKRVNDLLGHKAGDHVLMECARRMRASVLGASDLIGRVGGDEFLIALKGTGADDVYLCQVAQGIVTSLCEPIVLEDGQVANIGASVGISCYPRHGVTRKALLSAADAAMYEVKRTGKNSFAMALEAAVES